LEASKYTLFSIHQYPAKPLENLFIPLIRIDFYIPGLLVIQNPKPSKTVEVMRSLTNLTDQQLIHLFVEGESDALETLILRHKDKIYTSIFLLVKDKYLAEDIFQDVFIRVIDTVRSGRYTEEGKFLPWAMRIAHNLCVDHFRKVKRTPTVRNSEDRDIFEVLNITEDGVDRRMMQRQSHDKVRQMLDLLPPDQREVIILRHYAEMSFKEIASMTNCSINTALGRMRYGLINLRKMMAEKQIAL
jgi:RNA polymerase sigma-70 factor (ECF subfamily)